MFSPDITTSQETPLIQRLVTFFRDSGPDSSLSISTPDMNSDNSSAHPAIASGNSQSNHFAAEDAPAPRRSGRVRKAAQYASFGESSSDPLEGKTITKSRRKVKKTAITARATASKSTPKLSPQLPRKKALAKSSKVAPKKLTDSKATPENHTDSSIKHESRNAAAEEIVEQCSRHDAALALLMLSQSSEQRSQNDAAQALLMMSQSSVAEEQLTVGGGISDHDDVRDLTPSAANDYKFQTAGTSELTTKQLDALLKPPARPKKFPLDLSSGHAMKLSYYQIGSMPKAGLAEKLVREVEARHALEVKGWEDRSDKILQ